MINKLFIVFFTIIVTGCTHKFIVAKSKKLEDNLATSNYAKKIMKKTNNKRIYTLAKKIHILNKYIYEHGANFDCTKKASSLRKTLETIYLSKNIELKKTKIF